IALVVNWLADPTITYDARLQSRIMQLHLECVKSHIGVINPFGNLNNSIKSRAMKIIANAGIKVGKSIAINNLKTFDPVNQGLAYPFLLRDDVTHGSQIIKINSPNELKNIPQSLFNFPCASEFIDVKDNDGYYRKYRCFLIGNKTIPRHLIISKSWWVHAHD